MPDSWLKRWWWRVRLRLFLFVFRRYKASVDRKIRRTRIMPQFPKALLRREGTDNAVVIFHFDQTYPDEKTRDGVTPDA